MQTIKINESFSAVDGDLKTLREIMNFLKVRNADSFFDKQVQAGIKSPFTYFTSIQNKKLLVMNGHLDLLKNFNVPNVREKSEYTEQEINDFLKEMYKILPFYPYDFQVNAFKGSIVNQKQINKMATSSGKSLTISLIAEFYRRRGKKGLILVPNIGLLTQFKNDIKSYNLLDLHEKTFIIGGGQTERDFSSELIISTWQSLKEFKHLLKDRDYIIVDEVHRFASQETSSIVRETTESKIKLGFTGTLPEDLVMKMELFGLFGLPITYITSSELIERGLATPISIDVLKLKYGEDFNNLIISTKSFTEKLKLIEECSLRNDFIVNLVTRLKGNSLVLFQHTQHGKDLFISIMKKLHPDVEVLNKHITGKKSFEFQEKYNVFFLNGEDDAVTREKTRKIMEEKDDAILVSNYQILSTGVNMPKLHNMILGSPLRSYTTVTQSLGRGMRLHISKKLFRVFDLVDVFGALLKHNVFLKQYQHRLKVSYNPEEYPVKENEFLLKEDSW